ncbi:minor capsid protein [Streptomyces sp. NPDC058308]|uniref:minor capsid protein n=1 Tax=Streptomyces sp. NPDC058308 TaxID=3346440 RepID=UPI0036E79D95
MGCLATPDHTYSAGPSLFPPTLAPIAIFLHRMLEGPDRAYATTPYSLDDTGLSDVTDGVQIRMRAGPDPREVLDMADAVRDLLHMREDTVVGGVRLSLIWRQSQAPTGRYEHGREELTSNYYARSNRPGPHMYEWKETASCRRRPRPLLRAAPSKAHLRFFDRDGLPEAYVGKALPDGEPQGGAARDLDQVQVTFTGTGSAVPPDARHLDSVARHAARGPARRPEHREPLGLAPVLVRDPLKRAFQVAWVYAFQESAAGRGGSVERGRPRVRLYGAELRQSRRIVRVAGGQRPEPGCVLR